MDMPWLGAIANGVLEGVTEFLPVSSTGHLILFREWLPVGLDADPAKRKVFEDTFDVVIQLPAILAIVALYAKRLWAEAVGVVHEERARRFWLGLVVAFLPAAVIGFFAHDAIEAYLFRPMVVAAALLVGGIVIIAVERRGLPGDEKPVDEIPLRTSLAIGLFQCLAMIPGTSRSAATIIGGRLFGLSRSAAAEYSFFLALPTMFAASGYTLLKRAGAIDWTGHAAILAVGCVTSFVTAYVVVAWFMRFLRTRTLEAFGWYRIILALAVFAVYARG
ncbi:MAG: undecaprenyl-diphosphate phosphatase [Deltaproteobacteria bacterium]|nr:undecaprenyl-diphosphate phosphatase [Deltaproteobacteria bacterium]